MTEEMKTLTVGELIAQLQKQPTDKKVYVWLPGSSIALGSVFLYKTQIRIEGNIMPGSALG